VEQVWNQLALTWGIQPVLVQMVDHTDAMTAQVDRSLMEMGLVEDGDLVVIAAGSPPGKAGSTNSLKVHKVGDLADSTYAGKSPATRKSSALGRNGRRRPRLSDNEQDPCRLAGVLFVGAGDRRRSAGPIEPVEILDGIRQAQSAAVS
jgi:hypothetical protein